MRPRVATATTDSQAGALLRQWRERRRLSQLELALNAGVSTRHLSCVETGRAKPGRDMLLRVLAELDVPFRERNQVLLAAGHAPALPERPLDHPDLEPVRGALDAILARHEPYPAIAVDRAWNIVAANATVTAMTRWAGVDPALLEPPVNAVRISFDPRGLAPLIVDLPVWRAFFRDRLERQLATTGDAEVAELLDELAELGGDEPGGLEARPVPGPLRVRGPAGGELSFIAMFATFDSPFEVTTSELAVELLFPADPATADALGQFTR